MYKDLYQAEEIYSYLMIKKVIILKDLTVQWKK